MWKFLGQGANLHQNSDNELQQWQCWILNPGSHQGTPNTRFFFNLKSLKSDGLRILEGFPFGSAFPPVCKAGCPLVIQISDFNVPCGSSSLEGKKTLLQWANIYSSYGMECTVASTMLSYDYSQVFLKKTHFHLPHTPSLPGLAQFTSSGNSLKHVASGTPRWLPSCHHNILSPLCPIPSWLPERLFSRGWICFQHTLKNKLDLQTLLQRTADNWIPRVQILRGDKMWRHRIHLS